MSKRAQKKLDKERKEQEEKANMALYDALDPQDKDVLLKQLQTPKTKVGWFTLFRYATWFDIMLLIIGYISAIAAGAALPMFTLVFGGITQVFTNFFTSANPDPDAFQAKVNHDTLYFLYLGIAIVGLSCLETYLNVERGEVLTARIRQQYLRAILKQNIAYFDKLGAGEVTTRIVKDTNSIQQGISEKAGLVAHGISTFVTALVIGFAKSWKLTLILLSVVFFISANIMTCSFFIIKFATRNAEEYARGSTIAEESLSAIRSTVAFGAQDRLSKKFDCRLDYAMKFAYKKEFSLGIMIACAWGSVFYCYALAFWEGSRLIAWGELDVGQVITTIMSVLIGSFVFVNVAPSFKSIGSAISAGAKIFETIDRVSPIDSLDTEHGEILENVEGHINFNNVRFIYPSRPDVTVLHDFNLDIQPGHTVALVGMSGSGKSTLVGLLERFYNPLSGSITLDGHEITNLNTQWLRQNIALVSQEPTLFSVSIYENIAFGLIGTQYENADDDTKLKLVEDACKQANAWDFIQEMTDGLYTNVGDRGFLMSGGQKQRIAIARAIISDPKILLLDEATSALDTKSEGVVQDALDRASKSRTTIVIAHRLSTIKDANKIVVMSKGEIVEQGTHKELVELGGVYHTLVEAQTIHSLIEQNQPASVPEALEVSNDDPAQYLGKDEADVHLDRVNTSKSAKSVSSGFVVEEDAYEPKNLWGLIKMLMSYTEDSKLLVYFGIVLSVVVGFSYPANAILFSKVVSSFMVTSDKYGEMRHKLNAYSGYFFMMGSIILILFAVMNYVLSVATVRLVREIRSRTFKQLLRMDIQFFDKDENSTGALTSTLANDGEAVEGLGGSTLGQVLQSFITLIGGIIFALIWNWRLGLVCLSMVPLLLGSGFARVWILTQLEERASTAYETSGAYACESIGAIRTVASLTRENGVWANYRDQVSSQVRGSRLPIFYSALLYGVSQGLAPWVMGLAFWYGSTLLKTYTIDTNEFFVAFIGVVFGAQAAGNIFSYSPDMGKAKASASNIDRVMSRTPKIDTWSIEGKAPENVEGNIDFVDVHFRYPTRPMVPVLRGLNLSIKKGQYVALVGSSGCGKSTTIGLIERFYSVIAGQVLMDGEDITDLNVSKYREHISLVQQEPVLYSGSIRDNIMIGAIDESTVTEDDMHQAAIKANIHDFITSLPDGYNTSCGSKGAMLSGGQKQRIAIARALIRNPKILLLDEATSALDSESEKVVQAALDQAAKGRTTIAVAHRLSTIQNADIIYVFENGRILESGTHNELLKNKSKYYELVRMQSLDA